MSDDIKPIQNDDGDEIGRAHKIPEDVERATFQNNDDGEGQVIAETDDDYLYWLEPEPIAGMTWIDEDVLGVFYVQ